MSEKKRSGSAEPSTFVWCGYGIDDPSPLKRGLAVTCEGDGAVSSAIFLGRGEEQREKRRGGSTSACGADNVSSRVDLRGPS